jgi:hypothetical protein
MFFSFSKLLSKRGDQYTGGLPFGKSRVYALRHTTNAATDRNAISDGMLLFHYSIKLGDCIESANLFYWFKKFLFPGLQYYYPRWLVQFFFLSLLWDVILPGIGLMSISVIKLS